MEAVLRRFEGAQGSGLTDFPFPGARRDPRNFLVGPAVFIHEFQEQNPSEVSAPRSGGSRCQSLVEPRRSGKVFPAGERASGKEDAPVGGAEVARVGRRVSSLIPGLWLPSMPGLEGLHSPKREFRFSSIFKT